jgi:GDP-mannose 6-dehydrogenase
MVETLMGKGYDVQIYDKNVHLSRLTGTNKEYIDSRIPHLSRVMVSHLDELVDNADVIVVNNREKEYIDVLLETESPAAIVDMVRLPEPIRTRSNYYGINW